MLWSAFAFAAGIALYFTLPTEPSWPFVALIAVFTIGTLLNAGRRRFLTWNTVLLLACAGGVLAGAIRNAAVEAPRLAEPMSAELSGLVFERKAGPKHDRLVLKVLAVNGHAVSAGTFPLKVRLRVPKGSAGEVGAHVRLRGRLFPPPGPVHPGGYDFSFRAHFSQIGATGFSFGPPEVLGSADSGPRLIFAAQVSQIRSHLAERIRTELGSRPETALIVALLVGDRSGITDEQEEALRTSGLAHILAISGLHMALFAGGTYGGALLVLALVPALSLRWPTHKWAAVAALIAATAYLLLSGASVATQRSYLMISLVFLGLLVGRRGLTLRSVALAGLVLLLLAPERLFFPGFQMSFAAVICLVAVYDLWRRRDRALQPMASDRELPYRIFQSVLRWGVGLFVTALVAGLATGIVGAHHFGRVAPYGLVGNLLGMPVFTLLVMPMGVLSLVLMPFGLAVLPLTVMSFGVSLLFKIAAFTAALDGGLGAVGKLDATAAVLLTSALFAGLLLPGRLRLTAALLFLVGAGYAVYSRPPDLQIAASGGRLAARDIDGALRFSGRKNAFVTELWFQSEGVPSVAISSRAMKSPQKRCDRLGCIVRAFKPPSSAHYANIRPNAIEIAVPKSPEALEADCRYADIVVSDFVVLGECASGLVLDKEVRARRGAVAIWLTNRANQKSTPTGDNATPVNGALEKPVIERVIYAIPDPPRPWHVPGTVTYSSLRRASGAAK